MEETVEKTGTSRVTGVAQVFDLHALKAFAPDKRVRKMLFKTDQLWSEIACYEPGQSTVMHTHPKEEEAIFVLEGTAHMSIDGDEVVVAGGLHREVPPERACTTSGTWAPSGASSCSSRSIPRCCPRRPMGNVERCDKTLPMNEMIFYVRRDAAPRGPAGSATSKGSRASSA